VTGWLLIIALLILGGILSTLGDLLGSKIGKARLSIFNLRPKRTAILITVITGSLISSLSLGFMLLINKQLRVGLFELNQLQRDRNSLEDRITIGEKELRKLEKNLIALRRGNVVITTGQNLATLKVSGEISDNYNYLQRLLQQANLEAYRRVRPGERPDRQIILVPKADIQRLLKIFESKQDLVVSIRSAGNVLQGEKYVYAFPDVLPNRTIVEKGETISKTKLMVENITNESINKSLRLLLASTFAEVQRRGSISTGIKFNPSSVNRLLKYLKSEKINKADISAISLSKSDVADEVSIFIEIDDGEFKKLFK
tara:strand:- start:13091 stop:14032 length:942 start_codon:yes stop_codon:yes gene_type:complete